MKKRMMMAGMFLVWASLVAGAATESVRSWTSITGSVFEGVLLDTELETVTLRSGDGREISVRIDALSKQDQDYVYVRQERADSNAKRRAGLLRVEASSGRFLAPMFQDGPWRGALFVYKNANYTYVMNGALEGVLYPVTSPPRKPESPIQALYPIFMQRDPTASGQNGRWKGLQVTAIESKATLPTLLSPSQRGVASIAFSLLLANGSRCDLEYEFSPEGLRVHAKIPDYKQPTSIARMILANRFPSAPEGLPADLEELKKAVKGWEIEWKGGIREAEGDGRLEWWNAGNALSCSSLRVIGPWKPWTFSFSCKDPGSPLLHLGLYPGFSPARRGFDVNREASPVDMDLVLDWTFRFER